MKAQAKGWGGMDIENLGLLSQLLERIPVELRPLAGSALLALVVFGVLWNLLKPVGEFLRAIWRGLGHIGKAIAKAFGKKPPKEPETPLVEPEAIPDERTIWETIPVTSPIYPVIGENRGIPIITIANMKGGVGKTTLTANLAAYFQSKFEKPILVIDFDYQGSLTQTLRKHSSINDTDLRAHTLITGRHSATQTQAHARTLHAGLERVELFPAGYPFATIENQLMVDWASGRLPDDLRYRLCRLLRDPAFQERYAMVLIDAPPRITTGTINALCASTHLFVPTKLDEMSAEAAIYFLQQIQRMKDGLFPSLKIAGVIPTMTNEIRRLADFEERALDRLKGFGDGILKRHNLVMIDHRVPQKADIARDAGIQVAYLKRTATRPIFQALGDAVLERLH
jgi:cellulose biosynthesis protein BcsQ